MKEIEILVQVCEPIDMVLPKMEKYNFVGKKETLDKYYFDPLRKNLQPDENMQLYECLRLREKDNQNFITYKVDHFDQNGKWTYSDELECNVESINILEKILFSLGLKELITIENKKYTYTVDDKYEIVVEDVKDLGVFLEVEAKLKEDIQDNEVMKVKQQIQDFIDSMGIKVTPDLNIGKPEMMLRKKNNML